MEARQAFMAAGGREFQYIACLNDQTEWINAMCAVSLQHMGGWETQSPADPTHLADSRARALELGAHQ
jgi:ferrochelatase